MRSHCNFYSTQSAFRKQASHFRHPYPKHLQRNQGSAPASASTCQVVPVNIQSAKGLLRSNSVVPHGRRGSSSLREAARNRCDVQESYPKGHKFLPRPFHPVFVPTAGEYQ